MNYRDTAEWLKARFSESLGMEIVPAAAIILGTGLSNMAEGFNVVLRIPYGEIPGFVASTAPSHKGNLVLAQLGNKFVVFLQGRFHYYEGHSMPQVVFPTRVMAALGIQTLIVTNAAGSLRRELPPGSIVQLTDHINFMGTNPLIGANDESLGERFPSMNQLYDPDSRARCDEIAQSYGIKTHKGVYLTVTGPSLETVAECRAFQGMGADVVGMSTVPEVIVARHAGLKVLAYSIVTNYSNLFHDEAHSQSEIQEHADLAGRNLQRILKDFISGLP
ncbi:MAG: purine-nucleoside phosphorylase [Candidatus Cloacimonetes bacterium]|nr:purine-nucleoside phosphorylase [Candidatus Cloacimonadota bacterium]